MHYLLFLQNREVLRYYRLRLIQAAPEIGDAAILPLDEAEYLQADRMTAYF